MREYLVRQTMNQFSVSEDTARIIIRELDKMDMTQDYYDMIGEFKVFSDLLVYYNLHIIC